MSVSEMHGRAFHRTVSVFRLTFTRSTWRHADTKASWLAISAMVGTCTEGRGREGEISRLHVT